MTDLAAWITGRKGKKKFVKRKTPTELRDIRRKNLKADRRIENFLIRRKEQEVEKKAKQADARKYEIRQNYLRTKQDLGDSEDIRMGLAGSYEGFEVCLWYEDPPKYDEWPVEVLRNT